MAKATQQSKKGRQLVLGYLERIASKVFSDFPRELTALAGKQHGVYALYKGNRLYYVGLAADLRRRIKHHLSDKHAGKWDRFSLYLVREIEHIKELESLILRIADPTGNASKGRLPRAKDVRGELQARIKQAHAEQLKALLGTRRRPAKAGTEEAPGEAPEAKVKRQPKLAPYVSKCLKPGAAWFKIQGSRKDRTYEAVVRRDGTISFNGVIFTSPSSAGKAALGRSVDGWHFWRFKNEAGEWVKLDQLRRDQNA